MLKIEELQKFYEKDMIFMTEHVIKRCKQRGIRPRDIKNAIMCGEIIEQYPDDFPYPSCLIFGCTIDNEILHVVIASSGENAKIVTAYYPSSEKFESDMKTRKKVL